jgi:soluble lytic murein transglycosylase-like protein
MPVRVHNLRRKILLLLSVAALQAGLAAGPWRTESAADQPAATPLTALAAAPATADPAGPLPEAPALDGQAASAAGETPAAAVAAPAPSPAAALVPADRLHLEPVLVQAAAEYGVPADMILAQAWAESSWRVDAVSPKGAMGVLQLMPKAVEFVSKRLLKLDHELDARDPTANARMGARYMQHLLMRTEGDVRQALIAYNQGLSGLRRHGPYPAAEQYADKVIALRPLFAGQA